MSVLFFDGWVPTVVGQLSFSVIGESGHPTKAIFENHSDGNDRFLISYQKRPMGDALVPLFVINSFYAARSFFKSSSVKESWELWYLCLAHTHQDSPASPLHGNVFLFDDIKSWKSIETD